jgi:hypothetical protein
MAIGNGFETVVFDGTPLDQFILMRQAPRLILSNSPTAWWAGFLSDASEVYGPRSLVGDGYAFEGFGSVDLHPRDERYHGIDVRQFCGTEWTIRALRRPWQIFVAGKTVVIHDGTRSHVMPSTGATSDVLGRLASDGMVMLDAREVAMGETAQTVEALWSSGLVSVTGRQVEPNTTLSPSRRGLTMDGLY